MISYCKNEHRVQDQPYHTQICVAMQTLLKSHSELWITVQLNQEQWIQSRKEFIRLINRHLSRALQPYEMQMIMLTKSCLICHQQVNIYPCTYCWSVNYCLDDIEAFKRHHMPKCKDLALCLDIDLKMRYPLMVKAMKFGNFPARDEDVSNMEEFIELHVRLRRYDDKTCMRLPTLAEYFYSDYSSGPLTLYFGMKNVNLLDNLMVCDYVVHIIAANHLDREYLPAWELLLHLLRCIKNLKIILIGPGLLEESDSVKICYHCEYQQKQKLTFKCYQKLYHNYVRSDSYMRPNIIIMYQADLSDWEALSESILKLKDQKRPLLLTASSKHKSIQNINKIEEVLGSPVNLLYNDENKFASLKPYRDLKNENVAYRNEYLAICRKL